LSRRALRLAVGLMLLADPACAESNQTLADQTLAATEAQPQAVSLQTFDIPAQPLAAALEQYGNLTGRDAIYKSSLMMGRRSMALRGPYAPDEALVLLLQGTGLSVAYASSKSFVLLPAAVPVTAALPYAASQYYGRVQVGLRQALCAASAARPGNYRVAVRLWFDAAGNVVRHERWNSTGAAWRDEMIDQALQRVRIGMPPPVGLVQPVSIVIRPQGPGVTMGCEEAAIRHAGTVP
jgi:hypothetical protein